MQTRGVPVRLELYTTDATTALSIGIYGDNSEAITLKPNERLLIWEIHYASFFSSAAAIATVFADQDGDGNIDVGERIVEFPLDSPTRGRHQSGPDGIPAVEGAAPKLKATAAGGISITGLAGIIKSKTEGVRPSFKESLVPGK